MKTSFLKKTDYADRDFCALIVELDEELRKIYGEFMDSYALVFFLKGIQL